MLREVKVKITPEYSANKKKKSVASNLSFFTFNTKNSTNLFYINIYGYQPVEYYIIYSTKKLNAASSSRLHKWETGRFW